MHPHDEAVEEYNRLQPQHFPFLIRIDFREQYSWDIFETETLLQLWLQADAENEVDKSFLHLSFYGVDFCSLRPSSIQRLLLKIESIRHWQYENKALKIAFMHAAM